MRCANCPYAGDDRAARAQAVTLPEVCDRPMGCSFCGIAVALVGDPVPQSGALCPDCQRAFLRRLQEGGDARVRLVAEIVGLIRPQPARATLPEVLARVCTEVLGSDEEGGP